MHKAEAPDTRPAAHAEPDPTDYSTPYGARLAPAVRKALADVAATAPSIIMMSDHLAAIDRAYDLLDAAGPTGARLQAYEAAKGLLDERRQAVRDVIATLPPADMKDAACIIAGMVTIAGLMYANAYAPEQQEREAAKLERMALGILPIATLAAGMDAADMGWSGSESLRVARYVGAGVMS
jgi:hypothetical protein